MADLMPMKKKHNIEPPEDVVRILREVEAQQLRSLIERHRQTIRDMELIQLPQMKAELRMHEERLKNYLAIDSAQDGRLINNAKEGDK